MTVNIGNQRGEWFRLWDTTIASNGWGGVPEEASRRVKEAFERGGMTLVASLWRGVPCGSFTLSFDAPPELREGV